MVTLSDKWKLLYDNECPLCRRFVGFIEKFDGNDLIESIALQDFLVTSNRFSFDELISDLHMINTSGAVLIGGTAVQNIVLLIPAVKPYRWMVKSKIGRGVSNAAYSALKSFRKCYNCSRRR